MPADKYAYSATFEFGQTNPAAIEAIFGPAYAAYQMTLDIPAKRRTPWEWLTRKPRHQARRIVIPNAILKGENYAR